MKRRFLSQRGDTIIEVMISMAIMGVVLAGAYVTSNQSVKLIQDAQEHEQATALAQSQIEVLGQQAAGFTTDTSFCFDSSGNVAATTSTSCTGQGQGGLYNIVITKQTPNSGPTADVPLNTYEVDVSWLRLGGGNDSVVMFYQPELTT